MTIVRLCAFTIDSTGGNSGYHELMFEGTKEKSTHGEYVEPLKELEM